MKISPFGFLPRCFGLLSNPAELVGLQAKEKARDKWQSSSNERNRDFSPTN